MGAISLSAQSKPPAITKLLPDCGLQTFNNKDTDNSMS